MAPKAAEAALINYAMKNPEQAQATGKAALSAAKDVAADPKFQQDAMEQGKKLGNQGMAIGMNYGRQFRSYIQSGNWTIRILCLICGCVTTVIGALNFLNVIALLIEPLSLVLNVYTFIFGIVTISIEADPDQLESVPILCFFSNRVLKGQQWLHVNAKFLTLLAGRGIFYIMVGMVLMSETHIFFYIAGIANITAGVLCLLTFLGYDAEGALKKQMLPPSGQEYREALAVYDEKSNTLSNKARKELYALKEQAENGDLDPAREPRPSGWLQVQKKADWEARKKLCGMEQSVARDEFVIRMRQENLIDHKHT